MGKPCILIVDDEPQMARFVANVVMLEGLEAIVTTSAHECLEKLETSCVVGVFMDIMMPEMDGIELIQEIAHREPSMPVVIMSGYDQVYLEAAERLGDYSGGFVSGRLTKPFTVEDVTRELHNMLKARTAGADT